VKLTDLITATCALITATATLADTPPPITIADARASMAGQWTGELAYRDYTADRWFGIPMTVRIEDVGDSATLIRHAQYDDGPVTGIVRITTVLFYNAAQGTETTGYYRRGRNVEQTVYTVRLGDASRDATHWTLIAETTSTDDNRPARLRETTTRDGDSVTTLKEVDFTDDVGEAWLQRNRTTLTRLGG
jgi:hypothetical protein